VIVTSAGAGLSLTPGGRVLQPLQQLYLLVSLTLLLNGVVVAYLAWAYYAPRYATRRFHTMVMRVPWGRRVRVMLLTSALSLFFVFGFARLLFDRIFYAGPVSALRVIAEATAALLLYDFAYYGLHRIMHIKRVMRFVHGEHHRARNPSALDSFFQHPVELFSGIALMYAAVYVVGPVHVYSFVLSFFVYSMLNIVVHSGIQFGGLFLAPFDYLAKKHHHHHMDHFDKNFSSLTPLPDLLFGTVSK
jgi:sterol desaturase/sphingolipid hydroxylase (fatty acid hydroxylase superfamily)